MDSKEKSHLVKARGVAKGSLTRIYKFVEAYQAGESINAIRCRLEDLPRIREKFEAAQEQLELQDDDDADSHERYRAEFEETYYELLDKMTDLINQVDACSHTEQRSVVSDAGKKPLRLPTIQLPSFGGNIVEFRHFYDTFSSLVVNNESLDEIQKYHYLLSSLTGEAHSLIQNLPITASNFQIAWDSVCQRYNNTRLIVNAHVKKLYLLPSVAKDSPRDLRALLNQVTSNLNAIKALNIETPLHEILLTHLMIDKIDEASRKQWELDTCQETCSKLKDLCSFLEDRCQALELINSAHNSKSKSHTPIVPPDKISKQSRQTYVSTRPQGCRFCKNAHPLFKCTEFANQNVQQRIAFVQANQLCRNCLRSGHKGNQCSSRTCYTCGLKHHTLLHQAPPQQGEGITLQQATPHNTQQSTASNRATLCSLKPNVKILLSTALVKVRDAARNFQVCRALLDSCSQSHFITEACVQRLNLKRKRAKIPIQGVNDISSQTTHSANVEIASVHSAFATNIDCLVLPKISSDLPEGTIQREDLGVPHYLPLADPTFYEPARVDMLIGAEVFFHILRLGKYTRQGNFPVIQDTELGWILAEKFEPQSQGGATTQRSFFLKSDTELEEKLERFWELEEVSEKPNFKTDLECEKHFVANTTRDDTGRFIVRIPFAGDTNELGDSRQIAMRRLLSTERRLSRDGSLRKEYIKFLEEYEELGHMERISSSMDHSDVQYFIPHHPVIKESSSTTRTRVVFDASAATTSGRSLNDLMHVGPTIQQDIWSIIIRFRTHEVGFVADIAKMYRQIIMHPDDRKFQRILWRRDLHEEVQEYELTTVTYGTACAPFLATRCLKQLAIEEEHDYPRGAALLLRDFYVDDCISGASTLEEAIQLRTELNELLSRGGFELRKWSSNERAFMETVPVQLRETQMTLRLDSRSEVKTLGLSWHTTTDEFEIVSGIASAATHIFTKRRVLGTISSVYDPLGLLAPIVVMCKLFMQKLWQEQLPWDDPLPQELLTRWEEIYEQLKLLPEFRIPRFVLTSGEALNLQLHGFSDASEKAYGACIYLRSSNREGKTTVRLLCAKSKVAPLKKISLPRLELCGALLLARLLKKTLSALNLQVATVCLWTDSTITLSWIAASPSRWKTFVANRVAEIQELTSVDYWRHVPSSLNPADLVSRGEHAKTLMHSSLWWNGPSYIALDGSFWPEFSQNQSNEEEIPDRRKVTITCSTLLGDQDITERFSDLSRLQRVLAYVQRFIYNCKRPKEERRTESLMFEELNSALQLSIRIAQTREYDREIVALENGQQVHKRSKLKSLNPFICSQGMLRVGGRLEKSQLSFDQRHQIILSPNHYLTELIVISEHKRLLHAGCQLLLTSLRQRYWIVNGRSTVKRIIHKCLICCRLKATGANQLMGQLPTHRLQPTYPFVNSGLDFAGPIYVKSGSRKSRTLVKCYIAIYFVCLATRAIHLEVVSDMTSQTFVAALRRFISRRGRCANLYSDNGGTFVRANKNLRELSELFTKEWVSQIQHYTAMEGIHWHFIPPRAPHMGGLWEAGVKSFKYHLRRTMGTSNLTFEELTTLVTQIEACLNSRPLTPISEDPDDISALTPGHFLIGRPITSLPEPDLKESSLSLLSRWQRLQQMVQNFWKRWSSDYLCHLQQRSKWSTQNDNIQPGRLVIVKEDNVPPLHWNLAVVTEVHPGADGIVRVVTIRTSAGSFKRPVTKLCPLPVRE